MTLADLLGGQPPPDEEQTVYNVKKYGAAGDDTADDTAAIQGAIDDAKAGGGGTVYFPPGIYRVTSTIWLPRTPQSYWNIPNGAVHLVGAGAPFTQIKADTSSFSGDSTIAWTLQTAPIIGFADDGSGNAVVKINSSDAANVKEQSYIDIVGGTSYDGKRMVTSKDTSADPEIHLTLNTPFVAGTENETGTATLPLRAVRQRISDIAIRAPNVTNAACIRHEVVFEDSWDDTATYAANEFIGQRLEGIFSNLILNVTSNWCVAAFDLRGTCRDSLFSGCYVHGTTGSWDADPYFIRTSDKIDPSKASSGYTMWPFQDGSGLQSSSVVNCSGGNFPAFKGRMNRVEWLGGFYRGGDIGPCWDINNSYRSNIYNVGDEGGSEQPAEIYIRNSMMVDFWNVSGGGSISVDGVLNPGDFIRMENCRMCNIHGRGSHWQNGTDADKVNYGKYLLYIDANCEDCGADEFVMNYALDPRDLINIQGTRCYAMGRHLLGSGNPMQSKDYYLSEYDF